MKKSDKIYLKNRKELFDNMIEERGYIYCEDCNTSNAFKFHTHHIIFRSEKPLHKDMHNKLNLINLCNICHDRYHDDKGFRNKLVEERGLNKLFGSDVLNK
jgi:hypothetical protein